MAQQTNWEVTIWTILDELQIAAREGKKIAVENKVVTLTQEVAQIIIRDRIQTLEYIKNIYETTYNEAERLERIRNYIDQEIANQAQALNTEEEESKESN
jgi:hypothetical protein